MESTTPWRYYPEAVKSVTVEEALQEFAPLVASATNNNRKSCFFTGDIEQARKFLPSYGYVNAYLWEGSPLISRLKKEVEELIQTSFDYCLVHIYEDGQANIGWHNDKESLFEEIVSVSLGQKRKFRLKPFGQKSGWIAEYLLGEGDLFHMEKGCQLSYVHTVPKETTIHSLRVNFTFRKFDLKALIYRALSD